MNVCLCCICALAGSAAFGSVTLSQEGCEGLEKLIRERSGRLRDYESEEYMAVLKSAREAEKEVRWAIGNLFKSRGPVEPRPGEAEWWMPRHKDRLKLICAGGGKFDIVFFGDSISHNWEEAGACVLEEIRKDHSVLVAGFSGDRTYNAIWRALHGELDGYEARVVTLLIGTNNWADNTVEETAADIRRLIEIIRTKQPRAKILLMPILSRSDAHSGFKNRKNEEINALIASCADGKRVFWFDLRKDFENAPRALMPDGLHPGRGGYVLWWDALKKHL